MTMDFLIDGPNEAAFTLVLAHGAGAAMDSPGMTAISDALVGQGLRVVRFEFAYMAARRLEGTRKPPPKAELLIPEYRAALEALDLAEPPVIGGKSMGGRVASMLADDLRAQGGPRGLLCLGYPFHPPGKPDAPRVAHLADLRTPTLICQGTRDLFGTRDEVSGYPLSPSVRVAWFEDGDHDLKPRKRVTGLSHRDHLQSMAKAVRDWGTGL